MPSIIAGLLPEEKEWLLLYILRSLCMLWCIWRGRNSKAFEGLEL